MRSFKEHVTWVKRKSASLFQAGSARSTHPPPATRHPPPATRHPRDIARRTPPKGPPEQAGNSLLPGLSSRASDGNRTRVLGLGRGCRTLRRPGVSRVRAAQTAFWFDRVLPAGTGFDRLLWHECGTTPEPIESLASLWPLRLTHLCHRSCV